MSDADLPELEQAVHLHSAGRLVEAERVYRSILAKQPDDIETVHKLAVLLSQRRAFAEAEGLFQRVRSAQPDLAAVHFNYGLHCQSQGRAEDASVAHSRAIQLDPNFVDAHLHLASILRRSGRLDEAIEHWTRAVELDPQQADACMNIGVAMAMRGRDPEAIEWLRRTVALRPDHLNALLNLAWVYERQGKSQLAADTCAQALHAHPNSPVVLDRLAHALHSLGQIDQAIMTAAQAVQLDPRGGAWINLGTSQLKSGDYPAAMQSFRQAVQVNPRDHLARSNLLMAMNCDPSVTSEQRFHAHREFETVQILNRGITRLRHSNDRNPDRPLRIGYVSPDFRQGPVASFFEPILRAFDRSNFTVTCYSDLARPDATTGRLRQLASSWVDVSAMTDDELASRIQSDRQDILVDLTGHSAANRLLVFARKPAPVQVSYLGYLTTTGLTTIDYRLTDSIADPPGQADRFHTEALLRLSCFFCYQPPDDPIDPGPLHLLKNGYVTFGSLNHSAKFNPRVLGLWAKLLASVPDSRLMLLANAPGECERRLRTFFTDHHIAAERLQLVHRQSYADYLKLYQSIDIALDPFPFNGHTTSCDALWMGVPVVTLAGDSYASRTCTSLLMRLGLPELIAKDHEHYFQIAAELAGDSSRLSQLRSTLRPTFASSIITNATTFAADLESALRAAWRGWCTGIDPHRSTDPS